MESVVVSGGGSGAGLVKGGGNGEGGSPASCMRDPASCSGSLGSCVALRKRRRSFSPGSE